MFKKFEKAVEEITKRTAQVAQVALFFAMAIIVSNIILRSFWKPVAGTVELTEMAGGILLGMGVAYTAMMKGHIAVGIFIDKLPLRIRALAELFTTTIILFFTTVLARELFSYASSMLSRGYETGHLGVPIAPSIYLVAFGITMFAVVLLKDLIKAFLVILKGAEI